GDHARVAEAEPGRPSAGLAGGHDQGLEEAGCGSRPAALAFHSEQAAVEVTAQLDEARQVLQLAADAEVVGVCHRSPDRVLADFGCDTRSRIRLSELIRACRR